MEAPSKSARRRQDPVSCRLCRIKKLKCSRQFPCSNCVARKTECEFDSNQTVNTARIQQDAEPSNSAILSRLQRLEDMILRMNQNLPTTPESVHSRKNEPDQVAPPALTPVEESHLMESHDLTCIGTDQPTLYPAISHCFTFETVPIENIPKHEATTLDHTQPAVNKQFRIILPTYSDARMLFDQYVKYIRHFHNVLHLPTFRRWLEGLYLNISKKEPVNTDHAALTLAVFATVMCYIKWSGEPDTVPIDVAEDREKVFLLWFRAALDLLDHSRRVLAGSLEIVQTCIILVFLDYNLEGFTSRARAVLSQGLHSARELGMHRLDCPAAVRKRERETSIDSLIDAEIKRRLWWHMVSTDWMVSLAGSAQEGTYTAHPNQMRVRLPRNIEDEVLERGNTTEDLPLTHPTPMSYPLQRIRLAEISRSVIDVFRLGLSDPTEHDYSQVMQLDKRISNFIEDLPVFLQLDLDSMQKSEYIIEQCPYFAMQRYLVNIGAQSIRCKLHQPFVVRGNGQAKYAQSARTAIHAALEVIKINKAVRTDPTQYIPSRIKLNGLLHHMFLATVVLVMDVCFNGMSRPDDPRNADILNAIHMLEEAREQSASVQKFLDSLAEALGKHQVRLVDASKGDPGNIQLPRLPPITNAQSWSSTADAQASNHAPPSGIQNVAQTATLGFDEMWRGIIDQSDGFNVPDWDQLLFSELDTFIA